MSTAPKQPDPDQPEQPEKPKPDEPQGDPVSPKEVAEQAATAIDSQFTPEDQLLQTKATTPSDYIQAGRKMETQIDTENQDLEAEIQAGRAMDASVEGNEPDPEPDLQAGRKMHAHVDTGTVFYDTDPNPVARPVECPKCGWPIDDVVLDRACQHREEVLLQ